MNMKRMTSGHSVSAEIPALLAGLELIERALEAPPGHVWCKVICCECKKSLGHKYLIGTESGVSHGLCDQCFDAMEEDTMSLPKWWVDFIGSRPMGAPLIPIDVIGAVLDEHSRQNEGRVLMEGIAPVPGAVLPSPDPKSGMVLIPLERLVAIRKYLDANE